MKLYYLILVLLVILSSGMVGAQVLENDLGNVTGNVNTNNIGSNNRWSGFNFTASTSYNLEKVQILVETITLDTGNINVSIYHSNSSGPNGTVVGNLFSDTIAASSMSVGNFSNFTFSTTPTLVGGVNYWVVFGVSDTASGSWIRVAESAGSIVGWRTAITNDETWVGTSSLGEVNIKLFGTSISSVATTLNSPQDSASFVSDNIDFNATVTKDGVVDLKNATLFVWYQNGTVFNETTNVITNSSNEGAWNVSGFDINSYKWNVLGCGSNSSTAICTWDDANRTFDWGYVINSSSFDNAAFETDRESFQFNITTSPSILSVSALLNYNGTNNVADVSCSGVTCSLTSTIDIPLIGPGPISQDFFFQTTFFTADNTFSFNFTNGTQTVSEIDFNVCTPSLTTQALNFTAFDEQTDARISPFYMAGEFDFWLGTGNIRKSVAFSNTTAIELGMCISPGNRTFFIDDTIEYNEFLNGTTYNTRNYFFQMDNVTNVSQNIPLFLLNVDDSTSFILKVQDTNLLAIPNALIEIQRLNVGTGNFTTVQIAKTDDNGQTVGFFKTETVDYRFIIKKNGVTLLTTGGGKVVPETAPFTLTFTVGADEGAPWLRFEDLGDLTQALVFNKTSDIVSFGYEDTSGNFSSSRLLVSLQNLSGSSTTICDVNSTQSSAILTCDTLGVGGNYIASAFITRGSETFLVSQIVFNVESFSDVAGLYGVFLAWFIILISAFAFKFNETAGIVLMNIAVVAVNLIGLVNFGYTFVFGMMGVSIMIIVLLNK